MVQSDCLLPCGASSGDSDALAGHSDAMPTEALAQDESLGLKLVRASWGDCGALAGILSESSARSART